MRSTPWSTVAAAVAALSFTLHGQAPDAAKVLADARAALGGDDKLSAVRTFVATGRTRQVRGNNLVPIEFEINCELPDKFVRKDEIPAQDTDPTTLGFKGDELIQFPAPGAGRPAPRYKESAYVQILRRSDPRFGPLCRRRRFTCDRRSTGMGLQHSAGAGARRGARSGRAR